MALILIIGIGIIAIILFFLLGLLIGYLVWKPSKEKDINVVSTQVQSLNEWKCNNCGKTNTGKFCNECGKEKQKSKFCQNCGVKLEDELNFCTNCGNKLQ